MLLSVTGGRDLTLYEVDEAASRVRQEVDPDANIIVGATFDDSLQDKVRVSIVASGIVRHGELAPPPSQRFPQSTSQPAAAAQHGVAGFPVYPAAPAGESAARSANPAATGQQSDVDRSAFAVAREPSFVAFQGANAGAASAGEPSATSGNLRPTALQSDVDRSASPVAREPLFVASLGSDRQSTASDDAPLDLAEDIAPEAEYAVWKGPGDVSIVEDMPQLAQAPTRHRSAFHESNASVPHPTHAEIPQFRPAPPIEVTTSPRRMPDVSDFPPVGQKEYLAKAHGAAPAPHAQFDPSVGKRPRFFERWTNSLQRRLGESPGKVVRDDLSYDVRESEAGGQQANYGAAFAEGQESQARPGGKNRSGRK